MSLDNQLVTWTSSDIATATVNNQGIVEGQEAGIATVTATLINNPSMTSLTSVTVSEAVVNSIQVTPSTVSLIDGHTTTLTASATLSDGRTVTLDNQLVTWASLDTATAIVNNQGAVESLDVGTTTVTATLISDTSKTSSSTVTVTEAVVESIVVTPSPLSLNTGVTKTLSVSATLSNNQVTALDNATLTWSSSDPSVVTINSDGVVKAIASGTTSINATYADLPTVQVEVNITPTVKQISLNPERVLVDTNGKFQLEVKALLEDDSLVVLNNKLISWTVDDSSVALVNRDGLVQGVSDGSTRISATYLNLSDTSDIIVSNLVKETQSSVDIAVGVPFQWRAIYTNTNNDRVDVTEQATWETYFDTSKGQDPANELVALKTKGQYRVEKLGESNGYASDIFYTYNGDVTRVAVTSYTPDNISSLLECSTKQAGDLGMCRTKRIGGTGGGPKPIASCPLGSVATGLVLKHTTMGWGALGLQLKCSSMSLDLNNQLVFLDNDKESTLVHGRDHPRNTTGTYTSQCSVGSIISSIRTSVAANSYRTLDDVQLGCSPLSYDTYNSRYVVDKTSEQLLPWQHSNPTDVMVTEFENNVGLSAISVKAGSALDSTVFIASDLSMSVTTQ
ncbi:Bacterial Ig-like domain (Group 2) [Vibrio chagasii]|nr:Bacterial Ig-like domain (Group 2) [Vibrio chagasii]